MSDRVNGVSLPVYVVVGHLLFFGLLVLSFKYYLERTVYVDSAFQIFKWIQMEGLQFEAHRYTALFPQLAVKAMKLVASDVGTLLKTASAMHILVGWGVFTICAHVLKRHWLAVACALAMVLCTRLSFYGAVLEIHYLLSYPFLLMGLMSLRLDESRHKTVLIILVFTSLVFTLLVHPLGFLIALYGLVFLLLITKQNKTIISVMIVISLLWGFLGRFLLPPTEYEHGLYDAVLDGIAALPNISDLPSFKLLVGHTWNLTPHYLPTWIVLLASLFMALKRRAYLLAGFVLFSCIGFILLTIVTYYEGESSVMLEKSFLPLATLIAIPFIYEITLLPSKWRTIAIVPFVVILFVQFRGISFASRPLTERYTALTEIISEARERGVQKGIMNARKLEEKGVYIHWALPFESSMASWLQGRDSTISIISSEEITSMNANDFHPWFNPFDQSDEYFKLPEGKYEQIE